MAEVAWDLLAQYPNAGASFEQAFQQGLQRHQQMAGQNALSAYALNPDNQGALAQAIQTNPDAAIQLMNANTSRQREQAAMSQQQHEQWVKYAGNLAKWADTPQKWDQAIDYLLSSNHPEVSTQELQALKGHFDPALRASFMAQAGLQDDTDQSQVVVTPQPGMPAFIYDKKTGQAHELFAPNDGTHTAGAAADNLPTVATPQDAMKLPPGSQFRLPDGRIGTVPGGQTGSAPSGGFPSGQQ